MPSHSKAKPPSSGPIMRVAALVDESSAIAWMMRCGPATSPTMRRRVDISVAHIVPATRLPSAMCHSCEMAGGGERRQHGRDRGRHQQRQHHDQLAVDRLGDRAGEGAEQELRQLPRRHHAGDGERRAGDLEDEQARGEQLEPAHGVGEGADQPQPQEVGLAQQLSHCGTLFRRASSGEFIGPHAIVADIVRPTKFTEEKE